MCFFQTPDVPKVPNVPSKQADEARARVANEMLASQQAQGRAATVLTTPLGDSSFGQSVKRTKLGG